MLALLLAISCAVQVFSPPQPPTPGKTVPSEADKAAIIETLLNYADGFYDGSAERMAKALHPLLSKRAVIAANGGAPRLSTMNAEMLIEVTRAGRGKLPPEQRGVKAEVLDVSGDLASARVFTAQFDDYLHLMRTADGWRIVNVLWTPPVQAPAPVDKASVAAVARDYLTALAAKNGQAVLEALHPAATFRVAGPAPAAPRLIVQDALPDTVAEVVNTGRMPLPEDAGGSGTVAVLDAYENIATVKIAAGPFLQYAHLAKLDGRWRIVNALTFVQRPPQSKPQ
ncbi:MAG: hypothetical protein H6Q10_724 [Acidobacteria bacterium]|nr:hypothetical protein [Acidobacteriota bacterium]